MNISIASSGLGHITRGIEAWATDLSRALADRGEAVLLFKGGGQAEAEFERVIPCWQRSAPRTERFVRVLKRKGFWRLGLGSGYGIEQTTFAFGLLAHLRTESVDILHVQDPRVALIVQRARQLGWVSTRSILGHGTNESPEFLQKFTFLQHLAPHHLEQIRAAGVWKPTWTAIPNFINTDLFHPGRGSATRAELGISEGGLVVLTVAAIKRDHKRIDYLLDEFSHLLRMEPELPIWVVVAGGWEPDTDELVQRGRETLGDRVRFLVRFPRERMPELYRMADVFALCSLREMMPIALIEATASGLPCLVHQHPVLEWIVGPGGDSIDMSTSGALATALQRLLREPHRRLQLGNRARNHCLDHFSQDRVVDQLLNYYDFVHKHGRSTSGRDLVNNRSGSEATTAGSYQRALRW
jgi:1,2-diacylglycerol 3-alpha-glucosyltransferase